ncbi:MAG: response regulator [Acidobacteriaceae bacterium]|nr:response regulator [Acidobacteriaceae bacterium]
MTSGLNLVIGSAWVFAFLSKWSVLGILQSPAALLALLTPLIGMSAAVFWSTRVHLRALRTVTELRAQVEQLSVQKNFADAANAAKDEFLAKLSHEIRTPMNGIIAFAEQTLNTDLTPEQRQHLDTVLYSAEWLTNAAGHVLDFTRMQSSNVELESRDFSIQDTVLSAIKIVEPRALEKSLALTHKIDSSVPNIAVGDPGRLRQVLVNLLENAVRFTTTGSIMLAVTVQEQSRDDVLLRFSVADTGIGIPAGRQRTIFEPFQGAARGDNGYTCGAGLGLSICRNLVTLMGGTIDVQSQIGAGSTFRFSARVKRVRVQHPAGEYLASAARFSSRRLSILLAEAETASRRMNTKVLESAGHQVTPAASGQEAIDVFSTDIFDLVLLGEALSDVDPVMAAKQIRELESGTANTPLYLLGGRQGPHGAARRDQSGIDGQLANPIEVDELTVVVNRVAAQMDALAPVTR